RDSSGTAPAHRGVRGQVGDDLDVVEELGWGTVSTEPAGDVVPDGRSTTVASITLLLDKEGQGPLVQEGGEVKAAPGKAPRPRLRKGHDSPYPSRARFWQGRFRVCCWDTRGRAAETGPHIGPSGESPPLLPLACTDQLFGPALTPLPPLGT